MNVEIAPGDVISYLEMCGAESAHLQRGMNFRLRGGLSVVLMSTRPDAPYADDIRDGGKTLVYEGHNAPLAVGVKADEIDQPAHYPSGKLTENGKFYASVERFKRGENPPELVKVYEKIRAGIWVYNGVFRLVDAWQAEVEDRKVWKFRLELVDEAVESAPNDNVDKEHARLIPSHIKVEVWRRDAGVCAKCGQAQNLHFDHILPYSKGGTSLSAQNVQLLCQSCNLKKSAKIE